MTVNRWTVRECASGHLNNEHETMFCWCSAAFGEPFDVVRATGGRTTDPNTSRRAALQHAPRAGSQRARVLHVFREHYPGVLTAAEAGEFAGVQGGWKRVSELKQGGYIVASGTRTDEKTGMTVETFRATTTNERLRS